MKTTQVKHSTRKHSDFAASSSERWMKCAAAIQLTKKAPPQKWEGVHAMEGTQGHECLEFVVKLFDRMAEKQIRAKLPKDKWTDEMIDHAFQCAKIIYSLKPSKTAKLLIETRVDLSFIQAGMFGTLDYAWVETWGKLIVIDYKFGKGVPVLPFDDEAKEENTQLMYYALGLAHKFDYEFESVDLAIIQPRCWSPDDDPLTVHKTSMKRVKAFATKLKAAVMRATAPNPKPTPDESYCRWCPAASICPAVSQLQVEAAGIDFDDETGAVKTPELSSLDDSRLGKLLTAVELIEVWITKLRAHAYQRACDGAKIEGRKLVERESIRQWGPDAEKEAVELFGKEVFTEPVLKSPAQLEKAFGKEAKEFTKLHTFKKVTGYSLVKLSDRRPEVSTVSGFDPVEDEIFG